MGKFDAQARLQATSRPMTPVISKPSTTGATTALGHPGYERDAKGELFLLAISNFVGEKTFHEDTAKRDTRFENLVAQVTREDPRWVARFLPWLRSEANMRSASVVGAVEYALAVAPQVDRIDSDIVNEYKKPKSSRRDAEVAVLKAELAAISPRRVIDSVCVRADEPGEVMAYATLRLGRNTVPKPIKRGVADAACRLYNERNALKYDGNSKTWRFGGVIQMTHPEPKADWQRDLFKWLLNAQYSAVSEIPVSLRMIRARREIERVPVAERRGFLRSGQLMEGTLLHEAGMTWESLSGWLQGPMDAEAWEAVIPTMGYMALIRNLRNFDQAGVSDAVLNKVAEKIQDPDEVARSRQFPFRFLAAYQNASSMRWSWPLEQALNHSLNNVPALGGHTLVLVDRSPSMWQYRMSDRGTMTWADGAAIFGAALALRADNADLVEFGARNNPVTFTRGESVLKVVGKFGEGDGTDIPRAVAENLKPYHTRLVIITDEQTQPGYLPSNVYNYGSRYPGAYQTMKIDDLVPANIPVFLWNFAGYKVGALPSGSKNRHTFGGLTDGAFRLIPLVEAGQKQAWPF